jgi:hypothetical protein
MRSLILKTSIIATLCLVLQVCLFAQKIQYGVQIGSGISFARPDMVALSDSLRSALGQPVSYKVGLFVKVPFGNSFFSVDGDYCETKWPGWWPPRRLPHLPELDLSINDVILTAAWGRQLTQRLSTSVGFSQRFMLNASKGKELPVVQPNNTFYQLKAVYQFSKRFGAQVDYSGILLKPKQPGFSNGAKRFMVGLNAQF